MGFGIDAQLVFDTDGKSVSKKLNNSYFHNVSIVKVYDATSDTEYFLTTIPYKDENGNIISIKRGFGGDIPNGKVAETARNFANRHGATLTMNASVFDVGTNDLWGTQVYNGVVLKDETLTARYVLGIKSNNVFKFYNPGTTGATVIADGCIHAITSFIPLIDGGVSVSQAILDSYTSGNTKNQRQVIAQYANKDIVILTCNNGIGTDVGMTSADCIRILLAKGVNFAFMLDGGGSAQTVVRGTTINKARDGNGYTERPVPDFLYFGKDETPSGKDKDIIDINKDIGEVNKKIDDVKMDLNSIGNFNDNTVAITDCNSLTSSGEYWATASTLNVPDTSTSWLIEHHQVNATTALQIATSYTSPFPKKGRRLNSGTWQAWA